MPSVYDLKPKFQNLLRPLVKLLARIGVTANMVTMSAMLGSIVYGIWIYQPSNDRSPNPYPFLFLGLFLFIRMALNAIDGMLAREHNQQSLFGAYLNEVGDVVSDAALYLPFLDLIDQGLGWVIMIGLCCLTEFVGLQGKTIGVQVGSFFVDPVQKSGKFKEVKLYDSAADLMRDANAGRVDLGLIDYPIAAYAIAQGNFPNLHLVQSYKPTLMNSVGIGVRKDDAELMKKVNAAIDKLVADGTVAKLVAKWGL